MEINKNDKDLVLDKTLKALRELVHAIENEIEDGKKRKHAILVNVKIRNAKQLLNAVDKPMYPEDYDYELFFKSEPNDFVKIDGWFPIAFDRIKNHSKIDEYLAKGLLRRKPKTIDIDSMRNEDNAFDLVQLVRDYDSMDTQDSLTTLLYKRFHIIPKEKGISDH
jgi:hypothetical protein